MNKTITNIKPKIMDQLQSESIVTLPFFVQTWLSAWTYQKALQAISQDGIVHAIKPVQPDWTTEELHN